jgi:hypothetical protein
MDFRYEAGIFNPRRTWILQLVCTPVAPYPEDHPLF